MKTTESFGISTLQALERLQREGTDLVNLSRNGNLSIDIYKPRGTDRQKPHDKDEVYIVISGKGTLNCNNKKTDCTPGTFCMSRLVWNTGLRGSARISSHGRSSQDHPSRKGLRCKLNPSLPEKAVAPGYGATAFFCPSSFVLRLS
jgi:hypothetical protein